MEPNKYKFIFSYGDREEEREYVSYRNAEEAFDRACAVLDFTDCQEVRMFEYNKQYDQWNERVDLY